jgi:hypothetical protein
LPTIANPPATQTDRPTDLSRRAVWSLIGLGLLLFFFASPHGIDGDGRLRFQALQGWLGGSGVPSTKYQLIGSLPTIPLMLVGRFIASPEWWVSRYDVLVYAAGIGGLYVMLRRDLAADVLAAFLLLLGTTAMLPNSLMGFGAETFTVMAAGTGLLAWSLGRWKTATLLLGVAIANQPATIVGVALALGWWAWRQKHLRAFAPLVLGAGLWMVENTVRRGSPLRTGYENDHGFQTLLPYSGLTGFSYPRFFGVLSLLISFGKGLLFFAPGLVLVFKRGLDALRPVNDVVVLWLLYLGGLVLVYGGWWAWYGGGTWGPRFLLFASLPAALLLAAQVRRAPGAFLPATVVLAVLTLSTWVGIDGQTFGQFGQGICPANNYSLESFCWYVPEFSVLWTPFVHAPGFSWRYPLVFAYALGVVGYVSWPLLRQWARCGYRDVTRIWADYRNRAAWRF